MTSTRRARPLVAALLAGAAPATLAAQVIREAGAPPTPLVQELFLGEQVQAQPRGGVQLTLGGRADRAAGDWISRAQGLVEVGLTRRVQLSLRTPDAGTDLDPASRRYEPGVFVAIVPEAMPMAISAFGRVAFGRDAASETTVGFVVARTRYALQIHAASEWRVNDWQQRTVFAALYDKGRLTPSLELAIEADDVGSLWTIAPGLFVHPVRRLDIGAGALVSPNRGPVLAGGRVVLSARF